MATQAAPPPPTNDDLITLVPLSINPSSPSVVSFAGTPPPSFSQADLTPLNTLARILLANLNLTFPPPPQPAPNLRSQQIMKAKDDGNAHFRKSEWQDAIRLYSLAADMAATRPVFEANVYARDELAIALCNRSAAYMSAGEWVNALVDAEAVIQLKRPWVKGYFRKGKALAGMGRLEEAKEALLLGLQFDPSAEVSPVNGRLAGLEADWIVPLQDLQAAAMEIDQRLREREAKMIQ